VALTLAAILLARQRILAAEMDIRRKAAPVDIVVPSAPIPVGGLFTEKNLARKSVPVSGTGSRNVPAAEFELLLGARAKGDLAEGEPILWTDVEEPFDSDNFSRTIPSGRRALTFEADISSSFAGLIRPGDSVDLLYEGDKSIGARAWINAVPVISVDRQFGRAPSKEESREVSTITLSVTPEEGRLLATKAREGRIFWFLRNPDEPSRSGVTSGLRAEQAPPITEIWKAGIRELRAPLPHGEAG
jgi:Flp pilus assembly protein CpaB